MSAPQRTLTIAELLKLIKDFNLDGARGTFGSIFLGHQSLVRAFAKKNDKQRAYDLSRLHKTIRGGDIHQKLLGLSVLQLLTDGYAPLIKIAHLLRQPSTKLPLTQFYHAWHSFMAIPFDRAETFSAFERIKLDWHSRRLYQVLIAQASGELGHVFEHLNGASMPDDKARIALCTTQFLGRRHAPTAAAISMAEMFIAMGHEVQIFNQSLTPRSVASGFYSPGVAPKLTQLDSIGRLEVKGGHAGFWQSSVDEITPAAAKGFCSALSRFSPTHLISLGPGNVYADLAGGLIQHISMPSTSSVSIGAPGAFATVRAPTLLELRLLQRLGISKERIVTIPSGFEQPSVTKPMRREDYGLKPDDYAVAVVSNRLSSELSDSFLGKLQNALQSNPAIQIVFFGAVQRCSEEHQKMFARHPQMRFVGFSLDLFGSLETFDAVLNPPRSGGGTSAAYAMAHGLNLFTVPNCDVATVVGDHFIYPDVDAVLNAMLNAASDPDCQAAGRARSKSRWNKLSDRKRPMQMLLENARTAPTVAAL